MHCVSFGERIVGAGGARTHGISRRWSVITVSLSIALLAVCDAVWAQQGEDVVAEGCPEDMQEDMLLTVRMKSADAPANVSREHGQTYYVEEGMTKYTVRFEPGRGFRGIRSTAEEGCGELGLGIECIDTLAGHMEQLVQSQMLLMRSGNNSQECKSVYPYANDLPPPTDAERAFVLHAAKGLMSGDAHYRAYVGPPEVFDAMGQVQFDLLRTAGLQPSDLVVDIGCGALRLGRLLVPFLDADRYICIEPHAWLIRSGIRYELGTDMVAEKRPRFLSNTEFHVPHAWLTAEEHGPPRFLVAQSIFSHTAMDMLHSALRTLRAGALRSEQTVMLCTFAVCEGEQDCSENPLARSDRFSGWVYPGLVYFEVAEIVRATADVGLVVALLPHTHLVRQKWFAIGRSPQQVSKVYQRLLAVHGDQETGDEQVPARDAAVDGTQTNGP